MEIDFSATWKRQHCVLWLEGARTAWRTKSCIWDAAVPDNKAAGLLNARAALFSSSPDEQANNDGVAMAQEAAISKCRLEVISEAMMKCLDIGLSAVTMPGPALSVCSSPYTTGTRRSSAFET